MHTFMGTASSYMCCLWMCGSASKLSVKPFPCIRLPVGKRLWLTVLLVLAVLAATVCAIVWDTRVPTVPVAVGVIACVVATDTSPDAGHRILFLVDSCVALYCLWLAWGFPQRQLAELLVLSWEATVLMEKAASLGDEHEHEG